MQASKEEGTAEVFKERVVEAEAEANKENHASKSWSWFWKAIFAIVVSWIPFYGYSYFNARLEGLGYQNIFVSMDIWEGVNFFIVSFVDFFKNDFLSFEYAKRSLLASLAVFIVILLSTWSIWYSPKAQVIKKSVFEYLRCALKNSFVFSLASSFIVFWVMYLLPSFIAVVLAFITFFSILGYVVGSTDGREALIEEICIYGKSTDACPRVDVNGASKVGYVAYGNSNQTFFVSNEGRYYIGPKGVIHQYIPFSLDLKKYPTIEHDFDVDSWQRNIGSRAYMLKSFINEPETQGIFSRSYVLTMLGKPDAFFHYKEFPAYKLSTKTDCAVALPYDWDTEVIVNTVVFGDCKGVLK